MLTARALLAWRLVLAARTSLATQRSVRAERRYLRSVAVATAARPDQQPLPPRVGRPSKTAAKYEAKQFQDLARQLARLTGKQLARLQPLVGEEVVVAVALAARISHRNQGRQRQESLVAKLLRDSVLEAEVAHLQAAIESVRTGQGVIANPAMEQRMQLWMEALLASDAAAITQVFALVQGSGADLQQIRQLLRQAQQTEAVPSIADTKIRSSTEAAEAVPGAATAAVAAGGGNGIAGRPAAKALSARKQLRILLQPLAEQALVEAAENEI